MYYEKNFVMHAKRIWSGYSRLANETAREREAIGFGSCLKHVLFYVFHVHVCTQPHLSHKLQGECGG